MKNYILPFLIFIAFFSYSNAQTVTIGSQIWMTKNLDVANFRNGDPIPEAKTDAEWEAAGENEQPAWCYYDNDTANGTKYGKLYNWYAVNDPRGLAPTGYHIPTDAEWTKLSDYLGNDAGTKMKSAPVYETKIRYVDEGGYYEEKWVSCSNCSYWTEQQKANNPCTVCRNTRGKMVRSGKYIPKTKRKVENQINIGWNGTNESGFSGLPGGNRYNSGSFNYIDYDGYWWSSTEDYTLSAGLRILHSKYGTVTRGSGDKQQGFSVRCLRD